MRNTALNLFFSSKLMRLPLYGDISAMRHISATVTERFPWVFEFLAQIDFHPKIRRKKGEEIF